MHHFKFIIHDLDISGKDNKGNYYLQSPSPFFMSDYKLQKRKPIVNKDLAFDQDAMFYIHKSALLEKALEKKENELFQKNHQLFVLTQADGLNFMERMAQIGQHVQCYTAIEGIKKEIKALEKDTNDNNKIIGTAYSALLSEAALKMCARYVDGMIEKISGHPTRDAKETLLINKFKSAFIILLTYGLLPNDLKALKPLFQTVAHWLNIFNRTADSEYSYAKQLYKSVEIKEDGPFKIFMIMLMLVTNMNTDVPFNNKSWNMVIGFYKRDDEGKLILNENNKHLLDTESLNTIELILTMGIFNGTYLKEAQIGEKVVTNALCLTPVDSGSIIALDTSINDESGIACIKTPDNQNEAGNNIPVCFDYTFPHAEMNSVIPPTVKRMKFTNVVNTL